MDPSLLVTASDVGLPDLLKGAFPRITFTTEGRLRAVLGIKPGPMVILLDESQTGLVTDLRRTDVRAVVLATSREIPMVFRHPIVAVVERPLLASRIVAALERALSDLRPHSDTSPEAH